MKIQFRMLNAGAILMTGALPLSLVAHSAMLPVTPSAAEETRPSPCSDHAWNSQAPYRPPDFAGYFPDDPDGAEALSIWWSTAMLSGSDAEAGLALVRRGLRRYERDVSPILRWVGRTFIRGKGTQNPDAIELMYHAAEYRGEDGDGNSTRGPAIYFGLSIVRPKSDALLHALVDICMNVDDPNDLSRISWGLGEQRARAMEFLRPYETAEEATHREKAEVVKRILNRELKAHDWAKARSLKRVQTRYGSQLTEISRILRDGTSASRLKALAVIESENIALIMDHTFVQDFFQCALDGDPEVRKVCARLVGGRWIESAREPDPVAVNLMLRLSKDTDYDVRYAAVYYGLSSLPEKENVVIIRLLEVAFMDKEVDMYQQIVWGLRNNKRAVREVLDGYLQGNNAFKATAARGVYQDMLGKGISERRTAISGR